MRSCLGLFLSPALSRFPSYHHMNFSVLLARPVLACLFVLASIIPAVAQAPQSADKIIAIVDKSRIVLQSELKQQADQASQQHNNGLPHSDSLRCLLLQKMVMNKMLVAQAERDSLLVSAEEVEGTLDNRIRYFIRLYGS